MIFPIRGWEPHIHYSMYVYCLWVASFTVIHYTKCLLSLDLRVALIYRQGDKNSGGSLILSPYPSKFYVIPIKASSILKRKTSTKRWYQIAWRQQIYETQAWLMIDVGRLSPLEVGLPLGRWSWIVWKIRVSKPVSSTLYGLHQSCHQAPALSFCLDISEWWTIRNKMK